MRGGTTEDVSTGTTTHPDTNKTHQRKQRQHVHDTDEMTVETTTKDSTRPEDKTSLRKGAVTTPHALPTDRGATMRSGALA